jgi:hypothetical protein
MHYFMTVPLGHGRASYRAVSLPGEAGRGRPGAGQRHAPRTDGAPSVPAPVTSKQRAVRWVGPLAACLYEVLQELHAHGGFSAFTPAQPTELSLAYGIFRAADDVFVAAVRDPA